MKVHNKSLNEYSSDYYGVFAVNEITTLDELFLNGVSNITRLDITELAEFAKNYYSAIFDEDYPKAPEFDLSEFFKEKRIVDTWRIYVSPLASYCIMKEYFDERHLREQQELNAMEKLFADDEWD